MGVKSLVVITILLLFVRLHAAPAESDLIIGAISDFNGDLGSLQYYNHTEAIANLHAHQPALILGIGDLVSGEDFQLKFPAHHFKKMWDNFADQILTPITAGAHSPIPFMPTPGNHDAPYDAKLKRERDAFADFWLAQKMANVTLHSTENFPFYYSFFKEGVFFVSLNDVRSWRLVDSEEQKTWLRNLFLDPQVQNARAKIVFGHVPLYPVLDKSKHSSGSRKYFSYLDGEGIGTQGKLNKDGLAYLLMELGFGAAIFAHSHAYYPGKLVYQDKELKILSMPCSGPGQRYLHGQKQKSERGFAIIKVTPQGEIDFDMYKNGGKLIAKDSLPASIPVPDRFVRYQRSDL